MEEANPSSCANHHESETMEPVTNTVDPFHRDEEEEDDDDEDDNVNEFLDREESSSLLQQHNDDNDDDDNSAGDENPTVEVVMEPSYAKANGISFAKLVARMEMLYQLKVRKPKHVPTQEEKLQVLLPPPLLAHLTQPTTPPESLFPLLRLCMPEKDASWELRMKEKTIAMAYANALSLTKGQADYEKLFHYTDPIVVGTTGGVGDFSVVLQNVLKKRVSVTSRSLTVGQVNQLLDELPGKHKSFPVAAASNHDWRKSDVSVPPKKPKKRSTLAEQRSEWVRKLLDSGLSPLEHKWLVRILLERLQLGVSADSILHYYHPLGPSLWCAHNSLKGVLHQLCQPSVAYMQVMKSSSCNATTTHLAPYLPSALTAVTLDAAFTPMLSRKTGFQTLLTDLSTRHRSYVSLEENQEHAAHALLAVRHPAFCMEVKLDGERLLVHCNGKDGSVKVHSRRSVWYRYVPVLLCHPHIDCTHI
jgi:hypothetical protein